MSVGRSVLIIFYIFLFLVRRLSPIPPNGHHFPTVIEEPATPIIEGETGQSGQSGRSTMSGWFGRSGISVMSARLGR